MDSRLFPARVADTFELCKNTDSPKFLGFLTEEEAAVADLMLKKLNARYTFFGGYEGAVRRMLCCMPEWCENPAFPIGAVTFSFREYDVLSHRDFLGSLMALGIVRESLGDILVEEGRAVVFAFSDICRHITGQVTKVGRTGVKVSEGFLLPLPCTGTLKSFSVTVASPRLDCVLAAICRISRTAAAELIEGGFVSVNSLVCEKSTRTVKSGDAVSARSKGKFIIDSLEGVSKKGRIILEYKKYI